MKEQVKELIVALLSEGDLDTRVRNLNFIKRVIREVSPPRKRSLAVEKHRADAKSWLTGTVHWFDDASGEGVVKGSDGKSYFVHYSAIQSTEARRTLKDKQKVKFKLVVDTTFAQVSHIKEV